MWAQWVRNKIDEFKEEKITVCQDFMNAGAIKYDTITATHEGFKGYVHTVQEDTIIFGSKTKAKAVIPKVPTRDG